MSAKEQLMSIGQALKGIEGVLVESLDCHLLVTCNRISDLLVLCSPTLDDLGFVVHGCIDVDDRYSETTSVDTIHRINFVTSYLSERGATYYVNAGSLVAALFSPSTHADGRLFSSQDLLSVVEYFLRNAPEWASHVSEMVNYAIARAKDQGNEPKNEILPGFDLLRV